METVRTAGETGVSHEPSSRLGITRFDRLLSGATVPICLAWFSCAVVLFFLLIVVYMTFVRGVPTSPDYGLDNYRTVLNDRFWETVANTAFVGIGTTLFVLFFGVPMAWLIHRTDVPWKSALMAMIAVSVIIPGFMKGMGWILLLSPRIGVLNLGLLQPLGLPPLDVTSMGGIAWVQGLMLTPTLFFMIAGPMRALDPSLEESAEMSGATKLQMLSKISLPLLWPAILAGMIYSFMTAISIFEVAGILIGFGKVPLLATALFQNTAGSQQVSKVPDYGMAGVYGLLIAIPSIFALFYYFRTIRQSQRYVVVTGKGYRPKLVPLGPWKYVGLAFCLAFVLLSVVMPFLILLWTSFLPGLKLPTAEALPFLTLRNYAVLGNLLDETVITNTVILVVVAPTLVLILSLMISWVVIRTRTIGRQFLDTVAMLPHAVPGLGFAFAILVLGIMLANWIPWLPFYGTVAAIVLANMINRLAYTTRITNAALLQVSPELEEAAALSGAGTGVTIWRILVPLIAPSLMFAGLWSALLIMREVSMALLLSGPYSAVIASRIWATWMGGNLGPAAALGVAMVVFMGVLFLIAHKAFRGPLYGEG